MYIESIELDNFKSFGKKTFIPFLPGFTAISGPNGSGKSNIIDGFLFILGFSNKTIRAEKMPDLMNNLTNKSETKVTVVLYDPVKKNRISIARRIRRRKREQYESSYLLDNQVVTLSSIQTLLAEYKISSKAYNVVMQGDVTRIISMSALERRKIIDELSGVAEFDRKIEEAQKEIEQALFNFKEQEILFLELKKRLHSLEADKEKALSYQKLKEQRNSLERIFYRVRLRQLETEEINLKEKQVNLKSSLEKLAQELRELIIERREKARELELIKEQLDELELRQKKEEEEKLLVQRKKLTQAESSLEFIQKQIFDYQEQIERLKRENKLAQKQISAKEEELAKNNETLKLQEKALEELANKYQDTQKQILEKSQNKNLSTGQVLETQERLNLLNQKKAELETSIKFKQEKLIQIEKESTTGRKNLEEAFEIEERLRAKLEGTQKTTLVKQVNSQANHLERLKLEKKETQKELEDCTELIYEYQNKINQLDLKQEFESSGQQFGTAVKAILDLQIKGKRGILGVLAQLGQVEPRFQLALETCAGARLKSIVVDQSQTASSLIHFLREQRAGRATFLPLDKLKVISLPDLPIRQKGVIDWALNLVDCPLEYERAFAYAFGSTLVVEDLASAQSLIGFYRMVTLQGDLIERVGAITGGSVSKKAASLLNQAEKTAVKELPQKLATQKNRLQRLRKALEELEKELEIAEREQVENKESLVKKELQEQLAQERLKAQEEIVEKMQMTLAELGKNREIEEIQIEQKKLEYQEKQSQIKKLNILLISQSAALKDSGLEELVNYSQELEFEKKSLEVEIEKERLKADQIRQRENLIRGSLFKSEQEIKDCQEKLEAFFTQKRTEEIALESIRAQTEALLKVVEQSNRKIKRLVSEKDELNQLLNLKDQTKLKLENKAANLREQELFLEQKLLELAERIILLRKEKAANSNQESQEFKLAEELAEYQSWSEEKIEKELHKLENSLRKLEPVNMKAIEEYTESQERSEEIKEKLQAIEKEQEEINLRIKNYDQSKLDAFWDAYKKVNFHFGEIFTQLSFGKGELKLENEEQPFEGGLNITAKPRNKELQKLDSMSGGEKSLTALSLIFALQRYNPSSFYAFDEVDMFLDGLNAQRLAKMVEEQSQLVQFIVVSLRKPMLEACDRAVGVYAESNGFTQISGLNLKKNQKLVAIKALRESKVHDKLAAPSET